MFWYMIYLKILLFSKSTYGLNLFIFLVFKFARVEDKPQISFLMLFSVSDLSFTTFEQKGKLTTVNGPLDDWEDWEMTLGVFNLLLH